MLFLIISFVSFIILFQYHHHHHRKSSEKDLSRRTTSSSGSSSSSSRKKRSSDRSDSERVKSKRRHKSDHKEEHKSKDYDISLNDIDESDEDREIERIRQQRKEIMKKFGGAPEKEESRSEDDSQFAVEKIKSTEGN